MFVSQCPGWVCYAEKTHPELIPYMSTTKSPQQILGVLIKKIFLSYILSTSSSTPSSSSYSTTNNYNSNNNTMPKLSELTATRLIDFPSTSNTFNNNSRNNNSDNTSKRAAVMLVSIQPCFDKKLEASRLVRADRDHSDDSDIILYIYYW